MLRWLLEVAIDVVAFALGDEFPHARRARHFSTALLYGSVVAIFVLGLGGILVIFAIGERLEEPLRGTFENAAGLLYLLVLVAILVGYIWQIRRRRR